MAARAIASVTVTFGMVSIPVKLYAATQAQAGVSFNLLHRTCGSRLKQQYICAREGVVVDRADMVKGYEFAKDQYVTFTEDELKAMAEESSRTIDITEFVPIAKVDPIYFEGAYYLGPDKGGEKAYKLLAEAMKESGRCALAKWAARGKGYLALLRPIEGGLVMQILHYADEVRPFSEVPVPDTQVRDAELKLAMQLIDQISADEFHPENYRDEVRERYHAAIEQKVEGREVTAVAPAPARGQIVDLMEALKASLASKGAKPATGRAAAEVEERKPARRAAPRAEAKAAEARTLRTPRAAAGGGRRKAG